LVIVAKIHVRERLFFLRLAWSDAGKLLQPQRMHNAKDSGTRAAAGRTFRESDQPAMKKNRAP